MQAQVGRENSVSKKSQRRGRACLGGRQNLFHLHCKVCEGGASSEGLNYKQEHLSSVTSGELSPVRAMNREG